MKWLSYYHCTYLLPLPLPSQPLLPPTPLPTSSSASTSASVSLFLSYKLAYPSVLHEYITSSYWNHGQALLTLQHSAWIVYSLLCGSGRSNDNYYAYYKNLVFSIGMVNNNLTCSVWCWNKVCAKNIEFMKSSSRLVSFHPFHFQLFLSFDKIYKSR